MREEAEPFFNDSQSIQYSAATAVANSNDGTKCASASTVFHEGCRDAETCDTIHAAATTGSSTATIHGAIFSGAEPFYGCAESDDGL